MEVKVEPMSEIKPIRSFSVAILNQQPKTASNEVDNNNSIELMDKMKTINKK